MKSQPEVKLPLLKFFVLTYLIFFVLFGMTGLSFALGLPEIVSEVLQVICAWSPTFAFLIMFKRLMPGRKLGEYIRELFSKKLSAKVLSAVIGLQAVVFVIVVLILSIKNDTSMLSLINTSLSAIILSFLNYLVRGTLGEELGWRGYALNKLQDKYSPFSSSLIVGFVWVFWHIPLWFITGLGGAELLTYIGLFALGLMATSIIMTYFYNMNKNLFIPILIHQLLNFLGSLIITDGTTAADLDVLMWQSLSYAIVALILVVTQLKKFFSRQVVETV